MIINASCLQGGTIHAFENTCEIPVQFGFGPMAIRKGRGSLC